MNIFVSFRYTGEDPEERKTNLDAVCGALRTAGHVCYCSLDFEELYRREQYTNRQILEHDLEGLKQADAMVIFKHSQELSEGMLLETGHALAWKKPIFLAIKSGVKTTFLREFANRIVEFETLDELAGVLSQVMQIDKNI